MSGATGPWGLRTNQETKMHDYPRYDYDPNDVGSTSGCDIESYPEYYGYDDDECEEGNDHTK